MKKLIFQIAFMVLFFPALTNAAVYIYGTVTDSATNNPILDHPVIIWADSTNGFIYYKVVYTDPNGSYSDTVPVPNGTSGILYVQTFDCNNILHQAALNYTPTNLYFTQDFQICYSNSPCQADFTYYISGGLTVQFMDLSSGGNGPWDWSFGDNGTSDLQNPSHTYASPGLYVVTLAYGNANTNCYDIKSITIYLNDSTGGSCNAAFYYFPDSTNMPPYSYQFIDQSTGNITSWTWVFGDPASGSNNTSNQQNPVHVFSAAGTYLVCLTVQGPDSNCYDITCDTVIVGNNTGCQADFTYSYDSTELYMVHFLDQSFGNIISWSWNFGDGTPVSTEQNPIHVYPAPGTYEVCLTIQGADSSCYDITCNTVIVGNNTGCQAMFSYVMNPAYGAYAVQFTDQSTGNPQAWMWSFGDGTNSTMQNPMHQFIASGTYNVCLTITGNNCTSTYCQYVTVADSSAYHQVYGQVFHGSFPTEQSLVLIFSIDTTLNYNPYIDVSITDSNGIYYFSLVPDGDYLIYAIPIYLNDYLPTYYGDVLNWEQATVIHLGEPANPYDIHLIPSGDMLQGPGSIYGQVNMGSLRGSVMDKIIMLLLDDNGNAINFGQVSENGSFDISSIDYGTYYLHAELPGITSENVQVILTPEKPSVEVIMTFNGKNILGIHDQKQGMQAGTLFPNPVIDRLNVPLNLSSGMNLQIQIFNQMGQVVLSSGRSLASGQTLLNMPVSGLSAGMYTLKISSENGMMITRKLIITR